MYHGNMRLLSKILLIAFAFACVWTEGYLRGKAVVRYESGSIYRKYDLLAGEADYLAVLVADKEWEDENAREKK